MQLKSINSYLPLFKALLGIPCSESPDPLALSVWTSSGKCCTELGTGARGSRITSHRGAIVFCVRPTAFPGGESEGLQTPGLPVPSRQGLCPPTAVPSLVAVCSPAPSPAGRRAQACPLRARRRGTVAAWRCVAGRAGAAAGEASWGSAQPGCRAWDHPSLQLLWDRWRFAASLPLFLRAWVPGHGSSRIF